MPTLTRPRRLARRPHLEVETPIVAHAVARAVAEEVQLFLGRALPKGWLGGLALRALRCYAHSPSFREKMRRPGTQGRDLLYVFMRHWLADRLRRERPALFARLPPGFAAGRPLPTAR